MTTRARSGMTLMELVIGLAITGMMAAAGAGAFGSIIDHRRVIQTASVATERGAALRDMIRSWAIAGNVRIQIGGGPRGLSRGVGPQRGGAASMGGMNIAAVTPAQASGDEITLITSAINPTMTPNLTIRLYIDADPNTPEHGLTIEYQPSPQQPLTRKMLDSTIDSLKVDLLDLRLNRWFPLSQAATVSMKAVRLTLFPNPKSSPSPIVSLPLILTNGLQTLNTNR